MRQRRGEWKGMEREDKGWKGKRRDSLKKGN
jgi:hypothetical protein